MTSSREKLRQVQTYKLRNSLSTKHAKPTKQFYTSAERSKWETRGRKAWPFDRQLRVREVKKLRVVDAGVFPPIQCINVRLTVYAADDRGTEMTIKDCASARLAPGFEFGFQQPQGTTSPMVLGCAIVQKLSHVVTRFVLESSRQRSFQTRRH